jgi:hypothetical protein
MAVKVSWIVRLGFAVPAILLTGCAAHQKLEGFTRVEDYHLRQEERWGGLSADPMAEFERKHLLFGAVTQEQTRQRAGQYYTFFWKGRPEMGPVVVRFDFRRAATGETVHRIDQEVREVRARNKTTVRVIGDEYEARGRVVAWRASLLRDGQELDSRLSYLWE